MLKCYLEFPSIRTRRPAISPLHGCAHIHNPSSKVPINISIFFFSKQCSGQLCSLRHLGKLTDIISEISFQQAWSQPARNRNLKTHGQNTHKHMKLYAACFFLSQVPFRMPLQKWRYTASQHLLSLCVLGARHTPAWTMLFKTRALSSRGFYVPPSHKMTLHQCPALKPAALCKDAAKWQLSF